MKSSSDFEYLLLRLHDQDLRELIAHIDRYDIYTLARSISMDGIARIILQLENVEAEKLIKLSVILPEGIYLLQEKVVCRIMQTYKDLETSGKLSGNIQQEIVKIDVSKIRERISYFRKIAFDTSESCPEAIDDLTLLRLAGTDELDNACFDIRQFVPKAIALLDSVIDI